MKIPSVAICMVLSYLSATAQAYGAPGDYVQLWQSLYSGNGKPGYFQLKVDGTSGWVDMVKESGGVRRNDTTRLGPAEVQRVFSRLNDLGIWQVKPVPMDKQQEGKFFHTGRITIREGSKKREIRYQIDKEYIADAGKVVDSGLEPETELSQIDRYLSGLGIPLREPVATTPE